MTATQQCFKGMNIRSTPLMLLMLSITLLLGTATSVFAENTAAAKPVEKKTGSVARAIFTSQIVDREPVDTLDAISRDIQQVFFFTDLRRLQDQIITHRWEHNGQVMAEVKFKVGGPRWRVYSSKNLLPGWVGSWTVVVTDESGGLLNSSSFEYGAAASAGASPAQ
jgi:hypothetical protein